jgi:hypothetical protein
MDISYQVPHHLRTVRVDGRAAGFVRLTMGGHWTAYSYRSGIGFSPFMSETDAETWVHEHDAPVPNYSR